MIETYNCRHRKRILLYIKASAADCVFKFYKLKYTGDRAKRRIPFIFTAASKNLKSTKKKGSNAWPYTVLRLSNLIIQNRWNWPVHWQDKVVRELHKIHFNFIMHDRFFHQSFSPQRSPFRNEQSCLLHSRARDSKHCPKPPRSVRQW